MVAAAGDGVPVRAASAGMRVAVRIDGMATAVDPGPHDVVLETKDHAPIKRSVVLRAGEKRLAVVVSFDAPKPGDPGGDPAPLTAGAERGSGRAILGWSAIGVGVVAAGAGTFFAIRQAGDFDDAKSSCAPFCAQDQKDDIDSLRLYSGIAFAVAGAALVTGIVLLVTQPAKRTAITDLHIRF
jgi:hypothetical protein